MKTIVSYQISEDHDISTNKVTLIDSDLDAIRKRSKQH